MSSEDFKLNHVSSELMYYYPQIRIRNTYKKTEYIDLLVFMIEVDQRYDGAIKLAEVGRTIETYRELMLLGALCTRINKEVAEAEILSPFLALKHYYAHTEYNGLEAEIEDALATYQESKRTVSMERGLYF